MRAVGYRHAVRVRNLLQARRDINAVAKKIAVLDHNVADIDANAQRDAPGLR